MDNKNTLLTHIQQAIDSLNNVWPLLDRANPDEFKKRQKLLAEKRKLLDQYDEVLDDLLAGTSDDMAEALAQLQRASEQAKHAKTSIQQNTEKVEHVTALINQAVKAVNSVAKVLI